MKRGLVRRVERLEAKSALDLPFDEVISLDEHGCPSRPVPTRPDGVPIPVVILPVMQTLAAEDVQIMATPAELHQRGQHQAFDALIEARSGGKLV